MIYDLQKASLLKRITALVLDFILLCVFTVGIGMAASALLDYDSYERAAAECQTRYETQYGVSFTISQADYAAMTEAERAKVDDAYQQMWKDPEYQYNYNMTLNLSLIIISVSLLLAFLVLEYAIPMVLGNGQTVGKKVFGIGLMKVTGVKIDSISLFIRTVLGKFTIETMIPLLLFMMMIFGAIGIVGPLVILGILVIQIVLMITSHTNSTIHDTLAKTVAVDLSSQMIFGNEAQMMEYKSRVHEEMVRRRKS